MARSVSTGTFLPQTQSVRRDRRQVPVNGGCVALDKLWSYLSGQLVALEG
jgi:hypothetical protein